MRQRERSERNGTCTYVKVNRREGKRRAFRVQDTALALATRRIHDRESGLSMQEGQRNVRRMSNPAMTAMGYE